MDINTLRERIAQRDSVSVLETVDIDTRERTVLREFDYVIEAPNWTRDGRQLIYNSRGRMYRFELNDGSVKEIDTGFATDCNNDHVLSPDNTQLAISHFTDLHPVLRTNETYPNQPKIQAGERGSYER